MGLELENILQQAESVLEAETPIESSESPLDSVAEKPATVDGMVAKISPANWDMFSKVLGFLEKSSIIIKDSAISQNINGSIVVADISKIFGGEKINLEIMNPKKTIKLFKQFRNNSDVYIYKDDENSRFVVTNGEIRLFMPQQVEAITESAKLPEDLAKSTLLYSFTLDKIQSKAVQEITSDSNYIEYIVQDDKVKALHIPETAIYIFNEFLSDPKTAKLDETNADKLLRSDVFLPVKSDEYKINIGQLPDKTYFSYVECNIGYEGVNVSIYEDLKDATGGNLFG
jgi:hypothetical protein